MLPASLDHVRVGLRQLVPQPTPQHQTACTLSATGIPDGTDVAIDDPSSNLLRRWRKPVTQRAMRSHVTEHDSVEYLGLPPASRVQKVREHPFGPGTSVCRRSITLRKRCELFAASLRERLRSAHTKRRLHMQARYQTSFQAVRHACDKAQQDLYRAVLLVFFLPP